MSEVIDVNDLDSLTTEGIANIMSSLTDIGETVGAMLRAGVDLGRVRERIKERVMTAVRAHPETVSSLLEIAGMAKETVEDIADLADERPTTAAIKHALATAPSPIPGQTPAIQGAVVLSSSHVIRGALSETPQGGLRLLSPSERNQSGRGDGKIYMVEQFFDYTDVVVFAVEREIEIERSSIVQ